MNKIKFWFNNARPTSLPQSLVPSVLAVCMALQADGFSWWLSTCAVLGVMAAHLALNLFDDYFDYIKKQSGYRDELKHEGFRARIGKCPYLTSGQATLKQLLAACVILSIIAFSFGSVVLYFRGDLVLYIVGATILLGFFYSAPPLRLSYHGLGELVIGTIFGPLNMAGTYYAACGEMSNAVVLVSVPVGLLIMNIIYVHSILDFVPVHFATDAWALANFDGTALYEYPNDAVGVSEWGSHNFMHSRGEVRSLLLSAADLWLGVYGFDGLRLDAVSRIVYWQGDESRGVNGMGVGFLRTFCDVLHARHPGCVLIAEDSSSFPGITRPTAEGGLGFDYKWDLGWMHDTLSYFQAPPEERRNVPGRLTFSMMYYGDERYLLPLSHDEVVHGKATIAQKMNGDYERKFPQARALYLYMVAHPGKTLDFMGNEFAQLREWDETREQDWCLLDFPVHDAFLRFRRELGAAYRAHPALWERDYERDGFAWLDCEQREPCCWAILRSGGGERVAALLNLDDEAHAYEVPLPAELSGCEVEVLLDTDWQRFGGSTPDGTTVCAARGEVLTAEISPLSGMLVLLA